MSSCRGLELQTKNNPLCLSPSPVSQPATMRLCSPNQGQLNTHRTMLPWTHTQTHTMADDDAMCLTAAICEAPPATSSSDTPQCLLDHKGPQPTTTTAEKSTHSAPVNSPAPPLLTHSPSPPRHPTPQNTHPTNTTSTTTTELPLSQSINQYPPPYPGCPVKPAAGGAP